MTSANPYPLLDEGTRFPAGFQWGIATAAYQTEGAVTAGGRGLSIWDVFTRIPGKVSDNSTGDTANDHYHRLDQDLDLLAELGVPAYRFSISWARIQPNGRGPANPEGLAFYHRVLDGLRARGIRALVTLYHWDLPQALEDEGGWANRATTAAFDDYAAIVAAEFGQKVDAWGTLNEPWCIAFFGYGAGFHAPGRTDSEAALRAAHHLNLAHGLAVRRLRAAIPLSAPVSITLNLQTLYGVGPNGDEAVRKIDAVANRVFLEPLLRGNYPEDLLADTRGVTDWSFVEPGDLEIIQQPLDFVGINYYQIAQVRLRDVTEGPFRPGPFTEFGGTAFPGCETVEFVELGGTTTAYGWNISPHGLTDTLIRLSAAYPHVPWMVTENGAAFADVVKLVDGVPRVRDEPRIDYLRDHLSAVSAAITNGADVRGYFLWTFLDDFEWERGYEMKFGLVHIDRQSLARIPKDSAYWYRSVIASQTGTQG